MSSRLFLLIVATVVCGSNYSTTYAQAQREANPVESLAKALAERITADAEKRPRVTVLDLTDIQNRPNEFGRYLALDLAFELVSLRDVAVLDRANLETIMAEHQLTAEGLLRPEDAKKLGQFAGVDAILIGNLSLMGDDVHVFVRAISTETSEIVASGRATIAVTDDIRRMLGQRVDTRTSSQPGASASSAEGEAIAVREIGPVTAILRNVTQHSVQSGNSSVPAIRCTFDLVNRNLDRSVAVAANQRIEERNNPPKIAGYRGGLVDSNSTRWAMIGANGISAVVCFETDGGMTTRTMQGHPGAIVSYVRTAKKHDGTRFPGRDSGRYWGGSFGSIAPGETIRMTVDFIATNVPGAQRGQSRSATPAVSMPDFFQFDMELVLATYAQDEDPLKARDMVLRNLTVDRIELPKLSTASSE